MNEKKLYIDTYGCQMNVYDSDRIAGILRESGYLPTDQAEDADVIIVNTCSIRDKAEQKAFSQLGRYRKLKGLKNNLIIAFGGCIAQREGENVWERAPHVDLVFGTRHIHRLAQHIRKIEEQGGRIVDVAEETGYSHFLSQSPVVHNPSVTAFVTAMHGCDNFCSYCVVPYLRGREESRPLDAIIAEIEALVAHGTKEVTLLGQNVNSYGNKGDVPPFSQLLSRLAQIDGLKRIRFTTSHPRDLSDEVIDVLARGEKICNHLHLPVQSGSNRILAAMNRGYRREDYLNLVNKLRDRCPDISITSDMIVGFPGETEQDFEDTLNLMDMVKFDGTFSFKYSERPQTAAAALPGKIDEDTKSARLTTVQSLQKRHTWDKNQAWVGRKVEVLVEGPSVNDPEELTGRTRENRIVNFAARGLAAGSLVTLTVTRAFLHSLRGEIRDREGTHYD